MNKIRTYNDLLQEEQRLVQQLKVHETLIRQDLVAMEEEFQPVIRVFNTAQKLFTRDQRVPVFNAGLELLVDIVLRRFILAKSGLFTKIVIPYLVKNYSSHIISEEKRKIIISKIKDFFNKIRPKRHAEN